MREAIDFKLPGHSYHTPKIRRRCEPHPPRMDTNEFVLSIRSPTRKVVVLAVHGSVKLEYGTQVQSIAGTCCTALTLAQHSIAAVDVHRDDPSHSRIPFSFPFFFSTPGILRALSARLTVSRCNAHGKIRREGREEGRKEGRKEGRQRKSRSPGTVPCRA